MSQVVDDFEQALTFEQKIQVIDQHLVPLIEAGDYYFFEYIIIALPASWHYYRTYSLDLVVERIKDPTLLIAHLLTKINRFDSSLRLISIGRELAQIFWRTVNYKFLKPLLKIADERVYAREREIKEEEARREKWEKQRAILEKEYLDNLEKIRLEELKIEEFLLREKEEKEKKEREKKEKKEKAKKGKSKKSDSLDS